MRPPLGSLFAWAWAHREDLSRIADALETIAREATEIRRTLQREGGERDET